VRLQYALLCRAVQLCRPGGRIVYATCTFAPEENEGIIDRLLADHAQVVELESPQLPGVAASPGITAWRDRVFDPRLRRARRIWPHRQDSGGFFLASLRKLGTVQPSGLVSSPLPVLEVPELDRIVLERHAIAREAFHHWIAIRRSARGIQFVNKDHRPPSHPDAEASGLLLLRHRASPPKLSTCGAMLLGGQARRNVVDLTRGQMQAYFARADARLSPAQQARCGGSGNIIVRFRGFALGVAYYDDRLGLLHSRYPKRWAGIKGDLAE
jgi:NOL1/NOP2/fmu family ribosome biogenesis protein